MRIVNKAQLYYGGRIAGTNLAVHSHKGVKRTKRKRSKIYRMMLVSLFVLLTLIPSDGSTDSGSNAGRLPCTGNRMATTLKDTNDRIPTERTTQRRGLHRKWLQRRGLQRIVLWSYIIVPWFKRLVLWLHRFVYGSGICNGVGYYG